MPLHVLYNNYVFVVLYTHILITQNSLWILSSWMLWKYKLTRSLLKFESRKQSWYRTIDDVQWLNKYELGTTSTFSIFYHFYLLQFNNTSFEKLTFNNDCLTTILTKYIKIIYLKMFVTLLFHLVSHVLKLWISIEKDVNRRFEYFISLPIDNLTYYYILWVSKYCSIYLMIQSTLK